MTPTSKTILFFGNERLATGLSTSAPALRGLIEAGYKVAAVVVAQNEVAKSRKSRNLEVADIAAEHGIPLLSPSNLTEAIDELKSYGAEAAVLAAYGKIVPSAVLDIFPAGIINIHPSLLPLHRGSTPIESAIMHGDSQTGVSLMRLSPEMDAGPVFVQQSVELHGLETKQELCDQLSQLGSELLLTYLPAILDGNLHAHDQDASRVTSDSMISKSDAILDWNKAAEQLLREVRAYAIWPRSRCTIGTQQIIVTSAHVGIGHGVAGTLHLADKQLGIYTSDGILIIDKLIPPGKKEMDAASFLAGYRP
jgi:methionyl-tRNA formyltransferase